MRSVGMIGSSGPIILIFWRQQAEGESGRLLVGMSSSFSGVDAVIYKDLASALLAEEIDADLFLIATDVAGVMTNFGKPNQKVLSNSPLKMRGNIFKPGSSVWVP